MDLKYPCLLISDAVLRLNSVCCKQLGLVPKHFQQISHVTAKTNEGTFLKNE